MPNEEEQKKIEGQVARLQANIWSVPPYDIIKHLMTNPIMGPGGQVNTSAIKDSAAVSLGLLGTGASMPVMSNAAGAFRSSVARGNVGSRRPSSLSDEMMTTLGRLNKRFEGVWGKDKLILNEFHQIYPDAKKLPIKDEGIIRAMHRQESQGGLNETNPTIGVEKPTVPDTLSNKFVWTPEAKNHLMGLNQNYPPGTMGRDRLLHREFLKEYPNYEGNPSHIDRMLSKIQNESGGSTTLGSNFGNFGERPPGGPPKPRLNTDAPGLAMNELQAMAPVTKGYVKALGKDMGLSVGEYMARGIKNKAGDKMPQNKRTTYIDLKDPDNPGNKVTVRVPGPNDKYRHYGEEQERRGRTLFDTGYGYPPEMQINTPNPKPLNPSNTMNISNQSYADPKALEEALRLQFFGKAPNNDLRLVSPEYAKLPRDVNVTQPPIPPDPNQLKLLSPGGGYTTQDIINLLKQKNQDAIINPQET